MGAPEIVTTKEGLSSLIDRLEASSEYALDTEFHRERTYWPRLALVQVAWRNPQEDDQVALVDPLAVDPEPLARVLSRPAVMVAHAATQDLEVLARACGVLPAKLFDTQVAAGFLGYGSASLASLAERFLRVRLTKGDRLTDWSRRPLKASQILVCSLRRRPPPCSFRRNLRSAGGPWPAQLGRRRVCHASRPATELDGSRRSVVEATRQSPFTGRIEGNRARGSRLARGESSHPRCSAKDGFGRPGVIVDSPFASADCGGAARDQGH